MSSNRNRNPIIHLDSLSTPFLFPYPLALTFITLALTPSATPLTFLEIPQILLPNMRTIKMSLELLLLEEPLTTYQAAKRELGKSWHFPSLLYWFTSSTTGSLCLEVFWCSALRLCYLRFTCLPYH